MQPHDVSGERANLGPLQERRSFLFLQGPLSPLYARVADRLEAEGHTVSRINLCIGDRMHWRRAGAVNFRGRLDGFGDAVRQHMATHSVTDLVMHGECRDYHRIAAEAAAPTGARVFVTELGYLRPDWMTVDRDGTAAASSFPRDPAAIARLAERSAPVDLMARYPSHFYAGCDPRRRVQSRQHAAVVPLSALPAPHDRLAAARIRGVDRAARDGAGAQPAGRTRRRGADRIGPALLCFPAAARRRFSGARAIAVQGPGRGDRSVVSSFAGKCTAECTPRAQDASAGQRADRLAAHRR